jgi:flavin-dependent dehydrogenase
MDAAVAIIGAGPGGCAAAITLRRYLPETSVLLITATPRPGPGVGETLSPGVLPLLGYLGLHEEFLSRGHLRAGGTASAWGSPHVFERSYLFSGRGVGWHVDRARFDAGLLAHAQAVGARVLIGRARVRQARGGQTGWSVEVAGAGTVTARAVIDAAGRSAQLVRREGARPRRDDALVAEIRWYENGRRDRFASGALVESGPDGWWYSASLPRARGVAMFMTDADLREQSTWEERLCRAPATAARLAPWHATSETAVRAAHSQLSPALKTVGCVAAGDAAAAFDPISSLGIGFSLRSGMEAARVAVAASEHDVGPGAAYATSVERIYADYRSRHRAVYALERRWADSAFWARRHGELVRA